jgi:glycosyltransferase involved in cell wall biosynthesis
VVIGGSPDHLKHYRGVADRLGIGGRTHFCGPRPVSLLGFYLRQADILVSPRIQGTNTPMKIYSYLDSGRAVLATDLPTHTQVLDERMAFLAPPRPREMADGMLALIGDRGLRERLGDRARRRVREDYSLPAFQRKLAAFYEEVAKEASPGPRP